MSLRTKFAILVALLALTICGSMGVALWSFGLQRSQLLGPYTNTPEVIDRLQRVSERVGKQTELLRPDRDEAHRTGEGDPGDPAHVSTPTALEQFEAYSRDARDALRYLAEQGVVGMKSGTIASVTLAEKVGSFQQKGGDALRTGDPAALREALELAGDITRLVTRLNNHLLQESVKAIETVEEVRRTLLVSVLWAFLAAVLIATLALFLVRRWVLRPVARLRTAANRIAAGDFRHRVEGQGSDELAQLAHDVNHMAGTIEKMLLERVERERLAAVGEMVRRLAHNLRNPLSGIRGLAELTRDELTGHADLKDAQERIIGSVDRFERWLSDLLSVTKPLAVNPERARIEPLLNGLVEAHRPMARTKEIRLELDTAQAPEEAWFDVRHLEHSLVAIVTNAIQASPARGTVRITVQSVPESPEWEVRVSDQGPGVPEDLRTRVFNAYFTTKKDGNGIGLAVAQQVVRAHGGRITIEKGLNGAPPAPGTGAGPGATFVVRIPLQPGGPGGESDANRMKEDGKGPA